MIAVIVKEKDSNEISQLVKDLKDKGYKINVDFDFAYSPGNWTPITGTIVRQTKFTFYNEKLATWFILKYVHN